MVTNQYPLEKPSKTDAAAVPSPQAPQTTSMKGLSAESVFGTSAASKPAHAMDGSQFHNVIEEQSWSDLPPTREEQMPRRARHLDEADEKASQPHEQVQISVGPA